MTEKMKAFVESTAGQKCAVDISWSGGYDIDGDPMPNEHKFSPCGRPSVGVHRDTPLCAKHWMNFVEHEDVGSGFKESA
jgi:hypothetical protein